MSVRWVIVCLMLCTTYCARAGVSLSIHPLGLVSLAFSDGLKLNLSPGVQGKYWTSTQSFEGFMLAGTGTDLFRDGQTLRLPIPRASGQSLDCFGQLKMDDKDPKALHFRYRFTAPEATNIYSARLQLRMLAVKWAGQALAAIDGANCAPVLSSKPGDMRPFNGQCGGLIVGAGTSHEVRIELDAPHWCTVNDERTWGGGGWGDSFSIDLYALVADGGAPITAGQALEVTGTLRFTEPAKIVEPPAISPRASDYAGWKASLGLGVLSPRFGDEQEMGICPPTQIRVLDGKPKTVEATGQVLRGRDPAPWFKTVRRVSATDDGEMHVTQQLISSHGVQIRGAYSELELPRPLFDGCTATLLSQSQPEVILRDYDGLTSAIARAQAAGLRIDSHGQSLLTVTWKPATWCEIRVKPDAFVLCASFVEPLDYSARYIHDTETLTQDLTIRWGD